MSEQGILSKIDKGVFRWRVFIETGEHVTFDLMAQVFHATGYQVVRESVAQPLPDLRGSSP